MTYEQAVRSLEPGQWSTLGEEGRLEVLQALEDRAAREQGRLPRPVTSSWLYTGTDGIELGCYDPSAQTIYVNASQLAPGSRYGDNPDALAEAILHEGRHAQQRDVVEGRLAHDDEGQARAWAKNLRPGGYVSFWQNPRAYYEQPVESDARRFASERLERLRDERQALSARAELERLGADVNSAEALEQARRAFRQAADNGGLTWGPQAERRQDQKAAEGAQRHGGGQGGIRRRW